MSKLQFTPLMGTIDLLLSSPDYEKDKLVAGFYPITERDPVTGKWNDPFFCIGEMRRLTGRRLDEPAVYRLKVAVRPLDGWTRVYVRRHRYSGDAIEGDYLEAWEWDDVPDSFHGNILLDPAQEFLSHMFVGDEMPEGVLRRWDNQLTGNWIPVAFKLEKIKAPVYISPRIQFKNQ